MDNKIDIRESLKLALIKGEADNARLLSLFFRIVAFIFLFPALIFIFKAHSWLGFSLFLFFGIILGFVAYYFRFKTIICLNYMKKLLEEKEKKD